MYGVSCDNVWAQDAFRDKLGITIEQLSDFEPKGEVSRAFGAYHAAGFSDRALVMTGPDGAVLWSYVADSPGGHPRRQPDLRRARRGRGLSDLGSAPPEPGRHVRGPEGARTVIVYGDYECPFCAAVEAGLHDRELRVAFRHFPVRSSHPRAQAAAQAAEAAALQGAFWPFHDALFADQGRLEDPHLWARAEALGSTSAASTPTAARTRSPASCGRTSGPGSAPGWPRRRRCSSTEAGTPGVPTPRCGPPSNPDRRDAVYPRRP